jgi:putative two-component system response regulator
MDRRSRILIVEDHGQTLDAMVRLLSQSNRHWQVKGASDGKEGLHMTQTFQPDVIISDYEMPGLNGIELCKRVRDDPATKSAIFIILTIHNDAPLKVSGLRSGVDEFIAKPADAVELLARVQTLLRIKKLHDDLREEGAREVAQRGLSESFDRLLCILLYVLDLTVPGASARGERVAEWSIRVADGFGVPSQLLDDLRLAGRLHEIGRIADRKDENAGDHQPSDSPTDWTYTAASQVILQKVDLLEETGELVGAIYENWDGSGFPKHLRQGQIPLRSRILRTVIDLFDAAQHAEGEIRPRLRNALHHLSRHSGTRYDPLVLQHLEVVIETAPDLPEIADVRHVGIAELRAGMTLASDLRTSSGVKLLSGGSTITTAALKLLKERHNADPIIDAAAIQI